jgi:hypothetical protein
MQEPGGKQVKDSRSKAELLRLRKAVDRHADNGLLTPSATEPAELAELAAAELELAASPPPI